MIRAEQLSPKVTLTSPMPYFIYLLAFPITFPQPQHHIQQLDDAWATPDRVISNGPFIVDTELADQSIRLKRL